MNENRVESQLECIFKSSSVLEVSSKESEKQMSAEIIDYILYTVTNYVFKINEPIQCLGKENDRKHEVQKSSKLCNIHIYWAQ